MIEKADVVIGLCLGDESKGKISSYLASSGNYNFVARWGGGNNAGHTVYYDSKKYKTNLVPSGVFHGITSVIGPGCVLHVESFKKELEYLAESGFDTSVVKVSPKCHIITDEHIAYDKEFLAVKFGTTSRGIAPAYSDKYLRKGILAKDALPKSLLWDEKLSGNILCEGAQSVWLDIEHGNYPYVTSSHTLPYAACSLGFPPQKIRNIYGAAKLYDTKSGVDPMFPKELLDDPELSKVGELGQEFGVVTGRKRICNWLNLNRMNDAINLSGTNILIISKCDILEALDIFKLYHFDRLIKFSTIDEMKTYIISIVKTECPMIEDIKFSSSPETI